MVAPDHFQDLQPVHVGIVQPDVENHQRRLARGNRIQRLAVEVEDGDGHATGGEPESMKPADAAGAAGDECRSGHV